MQYEAITRKIIGCAMKVHSTLGCGFQEVIYQRAMAIEMEIQGLRFARELEMTIYYEHIDIGTRRVDFFVEEKIMVELKAVSHLDDLKSYTSNELLRSLQFARRITNKLREQEFRV